VTWLGIVAAIFVILTSIMLHEAGHFATAKFFRMKATRFFIGFGPTIFSWRRGETEYGLKAIPAGGFVKIVGMTPLEEVEPGDEARVFYAQPAGPRAVVLAAGSVVHFVLAILITYLVLVFAGNLLSSDVALQVAQVPGCVYTSESQNSCPSNAPASPALGRLRSGDRILSVAGRPVRQESVLTGEIDSHVGRPLRLVVERSGARVQVSVVPVRVQGHARIGVLLESVPVVPRESALDAVPQTFSVLGSYLDGTGRALSALPSTVAGVFAGRARNPNGPVSVVGVTRASGQILGAPGVPLSIRLGGFFLLMASLNFFIGLFNLLPLLPLDGGHLGILAFEQARSRLYRVLGRTDPGRVDLNRIMPVTYAVVVLFVGLSVVLLYADLFHPLNLSG
jgi:membrane-associated protease RseP (regulator of RpoE activity)